MAIDFPEGWYNPLNWSSDSGHRRAVVQPPLSEGVEDTTAEKIKRMEAAGISVAERIEEIPEILRKRLAEVA